MGRDRDSRGRENSERGRERYRETHREGFRGEEV